VANILIDESVEFDLETLDTIVKSTYPDLRKCINKVQNNCIDEKLVLPANDADDSRDFKFEMVDLFKAGKISEARKLVCSQTSPDEMEDVFRWLYDNVDIFGDEANQNKAILIVKQGLVDHALIVDPEINLASTLIRLGSLM
jgi:hypothetical protein